MIQTFRSTLFRSTRSSAIPAKSSRSTRLESNCYHIVQKRTFFASSTDHTSLLTNATVHRVDQQDENNSPSAAAYGRRDYILVPDGTPLELVLEVDKLQLARLSADRNIIFGAKVIQKSLGSPSHVCTPLLDAAIQDASSQGEQVEALASLDGLCHWVATEAEKASSSDVWEKVKEELDNDTDPSFTLEACQAIATGIPRKGHSVVGVGTFRDAQKGWELLAREYVNLNLAEEAELYVSKGATLEGIDYLANQSKDYMESAGGAMARFSIS